MSHLRLRRSLRRLEEMREDDTQLLEISDEMLARRGLGTRVAGLQLVHCRPSTSLGSSAVEL